ncbi:MAG: hypothetical protein AAF399_20500 [Bacteroidota bacterium]
MSRIPFLSIFGCVLLLILWSCGGPQGRFQQEFQDGCWAQGDTLKVQISEAGSLQFLAELGQDYAYRNLYLKVRYPEADGSMNELQLLETVLDPVGNWLVAPTGGSYPCQFGESVELPTDLSYPIQLEVLQFMRDSSLCEVKRLVIL